MHYFCTFYMPMYAVTELEITKRMNKNYIGIREQRHQIFLISTLNMRAATLLNTVKISYVCVCVFGSVVQSRYSFGCGFNIYLTLSNAQSFTQSRPNYTCINPTLWSFHFTSQIHSLFSHWNEKKTAFIKSVTGIFFFL